MVIPAEALHQCPIGAVNQNVGEPDEQCPGPPGWVLGQSKNERDQEHDEAVDQDAPLCAAFPPGQTIRLQNKVPHNMRKKHCRNHRSFTVSCLFSKHKIRQMKGPDYEEFHTFLVIDIAIPAAQQAKPLLILLMFSTVNQIDDGPH